MEVFSRYLDKAENLSLFNGFSVVEDSLVVNHLHYADDTMLFVDHNKEELTNLFSILHCFEFISCLKVNTAKIRLVAIGEVPELNDWTDDFGCKTDTLPFIYPGMPLRDKPNTKSIWNPILERFDARLSFWNQIPLSKGGKMALLKHILSSLPMYYFSLFKAPISIINILEKKMRNFLWDHYNSGSKCSH
ncbi:uncharacterized protein LOC113291407 [Papaver somniferum]|uniref:uncharacterized protein LOC113291407 n=1 Tax=Papaver somniferum TaxID=3469 RepID=UPI000E704236|nr:uncharacterized protein LOC113291407 [Papaver somniferum]